MHETSHNTHSLALRASNANSYTDMFINPHNNKNAAHERSLP